jgi:hypothetical protein
MPGVTTQWRKKNDKKKTNREAKEIKKVMLEGTKTIKNEKQHRILSNVRRTT